MPRYTMSQSSASASVFSHSLLFVLSLRARASRSAEDTQREKDRPARARRGSKGANSKRPYEAGRPGYKAEAGSDLSSTKTVRPYRLKGDTAKALSSYRGWGTCGKRQRGAFRAEVEAKIAQAARRRRTPSPRRRRLVYAEPAAVSPPAAAACLVTLAARPSFRSYRPLLVLLSFFFFRDRLPFVRRPSRRRTSRRRRCPSRDAPRAVQLSRRAAASPPIEAVVRRRPILELQFAMGLKQVHPGRGSHVGRPPQFAIELQAANLGDGQSAAAFRLGAQRGSTRSPSTRGRHDLRTESDHLGAARAALRLRLVPQRVFVSSGGLRVLGVSKPTVKLGVLFRRATAVAVTDDLDCSK